MSIAYGEPEGEGDARLTHRISEAGRDYLLDTSQDEEYRAMADAFFEITLTLGSAPEPGAGSIAPGQTVRGTIVLPGGDEWTFGGAAGQRLSLSVLADFDTYLEQRGPDGILQTADDDNGGSAPSRISCFALPQTGTDSIIGRETGLRYTLRLE